MAMPLEGPAASYGRLSPYVVRTESGNEPLGCRFRLISEIMPHTRPRPGRRRCLQSATSTVLRLSFCFLILFSTLCGPANATRSANGRRRERYGRSASELLRWEIMEPELADFGPGEIVYDRRYAVTPVQNDLYRRQDSVNIEQSTRGTARTTSDKRLKFSSTSTAKPAAATFTPVVLPGSSSSASTTSSSSTSAQPTDIVTAPGAGSDLPRPFDTGLGNNYTQESCSIFMNNFLRNDTFASCLPFSLLLQVIPHLYSPHRTPAN